MSFPEREQPKQISPEDPHYVPKVLEHAVDHHLPATGVVFSMIPLPEFRGLWGHAATKQESLEQLERKIVDWKTQREELGRRVPPITLRSAE